MRLDLASDEAEGLCMFAAEMESETGGGVLCKEIGSALRKMMKALMTWAVFLT